MTTMELIDRGIGHNCLSDAYDLGRADAYKEIAYSDNTIKETFEKLAYEKGRADAIDDFREKLFGKLCRLTLSMYNFKLFDDVLQETYKELKERNNV